MDKPQIPRQPPPEPGAPERPNQQDLQIDPRLPKQDVADALDEFDGDEN
jgi:hypothetical protein